MKSLKLSKVVLVVVAILLCIPIFALLNKPTEAITLNIEVTILDPNQEICTLEIKVQPEKRIPQTNNLSLPIDVEIFSSNNNLVGSFSGITNNQGSLTKNICNEGIQMVTDQTYKFFVKGYSHLKKEFDGLVSADADSAVLDFTGGNNVLYAGETSVVFDNYINSLDLSTQIAKLLTVNTQNDLNSDGIVNVLDISITLTNFLKRGDCTVLDSGLGCQ